MKTITATELRSNIYNLLDEVLETGVPLEISKGGKRLHIIPAEEINKLHNLIERPGVIVGDPDDLIHMEWEIKLDLP